MGLFISFKYTLRIEVLRSFEILRSFFHCEASDDTIKTESANLLDALIHSGEIPEARTC